MIVSNNLKRKKYLLSARKHELLLGDKTRIMGIVNITPDSFSQDGCMSQKDFTSKATRIANRFIKQGVDILDIGGESSRPGSKRISIQEELQRILPTITKLAKNSRIPISVDTYKSTVAKHTLDAGASIINNIRGVQIEKSLLKMVKRYDAAIVLMHMKGTPRIMQKKIFYKNIIKEIIATLKNSIEICLEIGIKSDKILIDPGIGFGKTVEHNLEIINRLKEFRSLDMPILIGTSRKSFIGKILNNDVSNRLMGTAATVCASILNGAHVVRVHDVRDIKECVMMLDAIIS